MLGRASLKMHHLEPRHEDAGREVTCLHRSLTIRHAYIYCCVYRWVLSECERACLKPGTFGILSMWSNHWANQPSASHFSHLQVTCTVPHFLMALQGIQSPAVGGKPPERLRKWGADTTISMVEECTHKRITENFLTLPDCNSIIAIRMCYQELPEHAQNFKRNSRRN